MYIRTLGRGALVAAALLSAPALASSAYAGYAAGKAAFDRKDYQGAMKQWQPLARRGDPRAMDGVGQLYLKGKGGVTRNNETAAKWFARAAKKGHAGATYHLALLYFNGLGVTMDDDKAVALFNRAANKGHTDAMLRMGMFYMDGFVVKRNEKQARIWFRRAVRKGSTDGMMLLSYSLSDSIVIPRDYRRAYTWLLIAREKGHPNASAKLMGMKRRVYDGEIIRAKQWAKDFLSKGQMPPRLKYEE